MKKRVKQIVSDTDTLWAIGLDPWIVADGNYWNGDFYGFYQKQSVFFALELNPTSIKPTRLRHKEAIRKNDTAYTITGEVIFTWEHGFVIDFGLQGYMYSRSKPAHLPEQHTFVTVEAYVGIDHFAYHLFLYAIPDMPPLCYHWHIEGITRQVYPLVHQIGSNGRGYFTPDVTKSYYMEQENTKYCNDFSDADQIMFPGVEKTGEHFTLYGRIQSLERQFPIMKLK